MRSPSSRAFARVASLLALAALEHCNGGSTPADAALDGHGDHDDAFDASSDDATSDAPAVDAVTTACPTPENPAGTVVDFAWPASVNTGHTADPGQTVHFHWSGTHNVFEVDGWTAALSDPHWADGLSSGAPNANGTFDWNIGTFPCGYRPGLYYFADEGNALNGVVAISVTDPEGQQDHYDPRPCSQLVDPANYGGRYARFASRAGCTQYEVNNFQTESHYDWVPPTFAVQQGDVVLFRWSGWHNVVQVHDVEADQPVGPTAINSSDKTDCAPGPNYLCANGPPTLGEYAIDTENWRPGMIHLSDQCAYNRADCPLPHASSPNATGMNMQFLLHRRDAQREPIAGTCCAIDRSKGSACRVVDIYNDNEGSQFDYNVAIHRGDLLRMRWQGGVRIVQTTPESNGAPSRNARLGGFAMPASVECVPGPNWSCVNGTTAQSEVVIDIDQAITNGQADRNGAGQYQFDYFAFGENTPGASSQDSGILVYVDDDRPYTPNPPCP